MQYNIKSKEEFFMTPKQVLEYAKENEAKVVDLRFMDFPGVWQHFTVPLSELEASSFEDGFGFDGSSIRGWQPIHASDMLVVPDATTAKMDPFFEVPTLVLIGNIVDPITRESYTRDPRNIARKAEAYLKGSGIGDTAYFGPEAEFFIFDDMNHPAIVRFTRSIQLKGFGTAEERNAPTSVTNRDTKRAISRFRPWTSFRIFGLKCF
jgi:glutamine synthetase